MKKNIRKILSLMLVFVLALSLTACGAKDDGNKDKDSKGLKIMIMSVAGVDDGAFNENCYDGIKAFLKTHDDSTVKDIKETNINELIPTVESLVGDYNVFVLPGFYFAAIGDIAAQNPDVNFIVVDTTITDSEGKAVQLDNVFSMTFAEQESGFFAGVAAALSTTTGKVAVVNGMAYPSNVNYQFGFMSGVNYANAKLGAKAEIVEIPSYSGTDVNGKVVGGNYIGNFDDQAAGKVVGEALIAKGCDILYVAAGDAGNGVFTAAKEAKGVKVIGCDVDQYDDGANGNENIILTSTLKVMDRNVTEQLTAIYDGTFKGKEAALDIKTDSTGYVSAEGRQQLSAEALKTLEECYKLVKDGKIVPAANFNGYTPTDFPGLK